MSQAISKFPQFESRLDGHGPLGVAVSGGGDSVALLYVLAEWSKRPLHVFCVDHGLNPLSMQWTQSVADHAAKLGAQFTALYWTGDKPATGLSAAARMARHSLLAEAARQQGIRVLCLGHTADDIAEADAMRAHGSNVGTPQAWAPSPVWPEGRGVFLYRPFLDIRREALRDYLRAIGATWIDDPVNENPASLRARVRAGKPDTVLDPSAETPNLTTLIETGLETLGLVAFDAKTLHDLPPVQALKLLSTAAVCAGGGDKLPRRGEVESLLARLPSGQAMTLCGARIQQADGRIQTLREAGDIGRNRGVTPSVMAGVEAIWDGRFVVSASEPGQIGASAKRRSVLTDADRAALLGLPAAMRGTLPVWFSSENDNPHSYLAANPALRQTAYTGVRAHCLVLPRFLAAIGAVTCESEIGQ